MTAKKCNQCLTTDELLGDGHACTIRHTVILPVVAWLAVKVYAVDEEEAIDLALEYASTRRDEFGMMISVDTPNSHLPDARPERTMDLRVDLNTATECDRDEITAEPS